MPLIAGVAALHMDSRISCPPQYLLQRTMADDRNAFPDLRGAEIVNHRRRAADVIGIAMRDDERVESTYTSRPERGREHAAADIECAAAVWQSTRVDEQA